MKEITLAEINEAVKSAFTTAGKEFRGEIQAAFLHKGGWVYLFGEHCAFPYEVEEILINEMGIEQIATLFYPPSEMFLAKTALQCEEIK